MPRTVDEHAETIRELVSRALADRRSHEVVVGPVSLASAEGSADRHAVLAEPVVSAIDLPPFDNSQMDGYAVHSADLADGPAELRVAARIPAGHWPSALERGWAAPIMTGAPVPPGADAVVPIEQATPDSFLPETTGAAVVGVAGGEAGPQDQRVLLPGPVKAGLFVRPQGSDLPRGATLFDAGAVLGAAQWGSLAAAGVEAVRAVDRPRILVVSTGEELTEPGRPLEPGLIYDANGASLAVALADVGAEVLSARVPDDADALLRVVRDAVNPGGGRRGVDLVVTMGGVSAGAYEVVRDAFEPRGVTFGSVAMQPGGPQGWGELTLGELSLGEPTAGDPAAGDPAAGEPVVSEPAPSVSVPVVCLPGNPVSVLVSFEAFLRLPLLRAVGRRAPRRDTTARLAEGADSPAGKHQMRRARVDDDGVVHFVGGPSSHLLHSYAVSNALAHIPLGVSRVEAGDEVVVWALDD